MLAGVICLLLFQLSFAQDLHFSQFDQTPMNINPGLTGVFGGDIRLLANYRSQWTSVPVDYITFSGAGDFKLPAKNFRKGFFSGGVIFNYDQAGVAKLSQTSLGLNGSYTLALNSRSFLTVGLQLSGSQRSFDMNGLTFNNQFSQDEGAFIASLPTRENFQNETTFFFDVSTGFNLRIQKRPNTSLVNRKQKRSKLDVGVGVFHLTQPEQNFHENDSAPLPIRISPYAIGTIQVSPRFDVLANFSGQFQGPYTELLTSLGGQMHISRKLGKQIALQIGMGYRFHQIGDAIIPGIAVSYNNLRVGFSYDVNISNFDVATRNLGGAEFSVRYIIKKVKPLPKFKICPLI